MTRIISLIDKKYWTILSIALLAVPIAAQDNAMINVSASEYNRLVLIESKFKQYTDSINIDLGKRKQTQAKQKEQVEKLLQRVKEADAEVVKCQKEKDEHKEYKKAVGDDKKELNRQMKSLEKQLAEANSAKTEIEKKYNKLSDAETQIAALNKQNTDLASENKVKQSRIDEQEVELKALRPLKEELATCKTDLENAEKEKEDLSSEINGKNREIIKKQDELDKLAPVKERVIQDLADEINRYTDSKSYISSDVDRLREALEANKSISNGTLDQARRRLDSYVQLVSELEAARAVLSRHYAYSDVQDAKNNMANLTSRASAFEGIANAARSLTAKLDEYCSKHRELRVYLTLIINRQNEGPKKNESIRNADKVASSYPFLEEEMRRQKEQKFNGKTRLNDVPKSCKN